MLLSLVRPSPTQTQVRTNLLSDARLALSEITGVKMRAPLGGWAGRGTLSDHPAVERRRPYPLDPPAFRRNYAPTSLSTVMTRMGAYDAFLDHRRIIASCSHEGSSLISRSPLNCLTMRETP